MKTQSAGMFVGAKRIVAILLAIFFAATWETAVRAQERPMQHFVLIFRSTRTLTPDELHRRAGDLREWISKVSSMGVTLNPRSLDRRALHISIAQDKLVEIQQSIDPPLIAMVFFDAADWAQAEKIARLHPGPRYGADLELREWTTPTLGH
jgi:hypothetical protein